MEDKAGFVVGLDYKYSLWGLDDQSEEYQVGFYSRNLLLMFHVLLLGSDLNCSQSVSPANS